MTKNIDDCRLNFILKWKCSEEELLEKCRNVENYTELQEVLMGNMILSVGGF